MMMLLCFDPLGGADKNTTLEHGYFVPTAVG